MKHLNKSLFIITWFIPFFDTGLFIYPSLSQSLLWGVFSCVSLLLISLNKIWKEASSYYTYHWGIILFYIAYLIVHAFCIKPEYYRLHYYLSGFIFLLVVYHNCIDKSISYSTIKKLLLAGLCVQLVFVYGQAMQILESGSPYFKITGCYDNPNVAAMYIALSTPIIANELCHKKRIFAYSIMLLLSLLALYLLNCRTAWLAITIPFTIFIIRPLLAILKVRLLQKVLIASCITLFLFLIVFLYQHKQNSADGRTLIWELSAKEIIHHPQGNGYGRFASVYNHIQSDYFKKNQSSATEQQNARFTSMAYNDYIENGVDGGIGGLLIHISLLATFIMLSHKQRNKVTFSIFLMIAVMSCVNFVTISILPWLIFLMAAGFTLSAQPQRNTEFVFRRAFDLSVFILTLLVCYQQIQFIYGQYLLANSREKNSESLESLSDFIGTSEIYHRTVAQHYIHEKEWQKAVKHCNIALQYTQPPSILQMKAKALFQDNKIEEAEETLQTLRYMVPSHLGCRFQLLQLYLNHDFQQKAHDMAHEILSIKPKVVSEETLYIQQTTRHYLNHIHHEHEK